jgi:hypothetical protein
LAIEGLCEEFFSSFDFEVGVLCVDNHAEVIVCGDAWTDLEFDVRIIAFIVPAESGKSLSELNLWFWESLSEIKSE